MTRKERKIVSQRVLAKEKLRQFYSSYRFHINKAIKFTDDELRSKLEEIEGLFEWGNDPRGRERKKGSLAIPFTYSTYKEFKKLSWSPAYISNRFLRQRIKRVEAAHKNQSFRNIVLFRMMEDNLSDHIQSLKNNCHLMDLCKISNRVGESAKDFRRRRLNEAKFLMKECRELIALSKTDMFIDNIEEHIRTYADFFVQCQFRLDKFLEKLNIMLFEQREMDHKKMVFPEEKSEKISLELPG